MDELHDFVDAEGKVFRASPYAVLTQLGRWLEERNGGLNDGASIATSAKSPRGVMATLEVHRADNEAPPTERDITDHGPPSSG